MKEQFELESLLPNNNDNGAITREGGGWGGVGGSCPPGPFEPEKSSLWMYLFCLDSVILIVVTCNNCLPFSNWRHLYRLVSQTSCSIVKCLVY